MQTAADYLIGPSELALQFYPLTSLAHKNTNHKIRGQKLNPYQSKLELFQISLLISCAALLLLQLLSNASYGFDFTDEGYYLQAISSPWNYDPTLTQFSFIYHPVYKLLNGDLVSLRRANIVTLFSLALLNTYILLKIISDQDAISPLQRFALSAGFAACALLHFELGISTPSYNSLNLQALFLTSAGVFAIQGGTRYLALIGSALVGIGGWLTFMAKPSSAALLALSVSVFFLLCKKRLKIHYLCAAGVAAMLLLTSAIAIDGSPHKFIQRVTQGLELAQLTQAAYSFGHVFRIDSLLLSEPLIFHITALGSATLILVSLAYSRNEIFKTTASACLIALIIYLFHLATTNDLWVSKLGVNRSLLFLGLPLGMLGLVAYSGYSSPLKPNPTRLGLAALTIALPYVYAFGSNSNYWHQAAHAALFWLLATTILFSTFAPPKQFFLPTIVCAVLALLIVANLLQHSAEHPFRQPEPLRKNTDAVTLIESRSTLKLSEGYARYIIEAQRVAATAGFRKGSNIIDLSGQSPGLLFSLGALGVGQAWTIGGYKGSENRARASLMNASCQTLSDAWLLIEPGGPRSVSSAILTSFGSDLDHDYRLVGSWQTAKGAGGYDQQRMQNLYKPSRPEDIKFSCEALREAIR